VTQKSPVYRPVTIRPGDGALVVRTRSRNVAEVFHPRRPPEPEPGDDGEPLDMAWLVSVGGRPSPEGGVAFDYPMVGLAASGRLFVAYTDAHGWYCPNFGVALPDRGRFRDLAAGLNVTLTE
jgi:hypothetical protein